MYIKVLIFFFAITNIYATPVSFDPNNETEIEILISKGLIGFVPVVLPLDKPTTVDPEPVEPVHNVAKRSLLRGDNPSNDLLADLDGANYENGLNAFRRIKTFPTWVG
ncbi:jg6668 [Pararge aegeria aegeria]|uniref:Jg6668 protein n=1 Tax=Pararge aegeria aegeria TaxID=348720 RepID=A0A8S4SD13_9NEOP|nr:jg6668 [Pararge aegeria aegeria]